MDKFQITLQEAPHAEPRKIEMTATIGDVIEHRNHKEKKHHKNRAAKTARAS